MLTYFGFIVTKTTVETKGSYPKPLAVAKVAPNPQARSQAGSLGAIHYIPGVGA
jgi:hypothetical protein